MGKTSSEPRASARAAKQRHPTSAKPRTKRLRVAVITGTRAEFGLLRPVMDAIKAHTNLKLIVIAGGAHLLPPARTIREVESAYAVAATVPMQRPGQTGRGADAAALGRGVSGFAKAFADLKPDWVVVLGDRIEAFAAASAASIAGIAVCHIHGGDRAEGIADEAMRHAITKLAHLHCAATKLSAERIVRMGEKPEHVHVTGSPAIDGLDDVRPMSDAEAAALGDPQAIILHHPSGLPAARERAMIHSIIYGVDEMSGGNVLCLSPNSDSGRETILEALHTRCSHSAFDIEYPFRGPLPTLRVRRRPSRKPASGIERDWRLIEHLPRPAFLALLKRFCPDGPSPHGLLVGNSSAGLIEAQDMGVRVVNVGPRQSGRESGDTVVDVPEGDLPIIGTKIDWALSLNLEGWKIARLYGDGRAGPRIAALLAQTDPHAPALLRKRNAY